MSTTETKPLLDKTQSTAPVTTGVEEVLLLTDSLVKEYRHTAGGEPSLHSGRRRRDRRFAWS